jgi:hypothetical protein
MLLPSLFERREFRLLIWRQRLDDFGESRAPQGRELADLISFGGRELLDLLLIASLDRGLERFARLHQLPADRLRRLAGLLECGLGLRLLCVGQIQSSHRVLESMLALTVAV